MQWLPLSRELLRAIPSDRPHSKVEAAALLTADLQDGIARSLREYGRIFRWDSKTVKAFVESGVIVNLVNSTYELNNNGMLDSIIPQKLAGISNSANTPQSFRKHSTGKSNNNGILQESVPQTLHTDSANTPQLYSREIIKRNNHCPSSPSKDLFDLWNKTTEGTLLSKATKFSSTRHKKCSARLKERSLEEWAEIFRSIVSIFDGRGGSEWAPDFDWIIKNDENASKVQEGKFNWIASTSRSPDSRYSEIFAGA